MSEAVNAMTVRMLYEILKHTHEKYWRYYMMWFKHEDLFRDDYDAFVKHEKESGFAMWDDPPEGWTERDLAIYSKGYAHGRCVETGNISGVIRSLSWMAKELTREEFGFREGMPTVEQVDTHNQKTLVGFWQLMIDNHEHNDFVTQYPVLYCLQVKDGKIEYFDEKWKEFTEEDRKKVLKSMPTTMEGIPVSWESLVPRQGFKKYSDKKESPK